VGRSWYHTRMNDLIELERQGWEALATGRGAQFYGRVMTDDAIVVVPGMVLDRAQTLASWDGMAPWNEYRLDHERVLPLGADTALVTYEAIASRQGDERPYHAQLTSVYVVGDDTDDEEWRLAFHQQTPLP
jgi:ketosteroid isomerase-like protein